MADRKRFKGSYQVLKPAPDSQPTATEGESGIGTTPVKVDLGESIWDSINSDAWKDTFFGIVPFLFYDADNSSAGTLFIPDLATQASYVLPFRGAVVGFSVKAASACTGKYNFYLNGEKCGLVRLDSETDKLKTFAREDWQFSQEDTLSVVSSDTSGAVAIIAHVYVFLDPTSIL